MEEEVDIHFANPYITLIAISVRESSPNHESVTSYEFVSSGYEFVSTGYEFVSTEFFFYHISQIF